MPKLNHSNVKTLTIKTDNPDDPLIVELDANVTAGQALSITDAENKSSAMIDFLGSAIKSWNYTNEDGSALPVTADAVSRMPVEAFTEVAKVLTDELGTTLSVKSVGTDEKKG